VSNPLQRVRPGDPIPHSAETWNAIIESARNNKRRGPQTLGATGTIADGYKGSLEIDVKNNTGGTILQWSVLKITTPFVSVTDQPEDNQDSPTFLGIAPTSVNDIVCVTQEGAGNGEFVRATILGVAVCKINVTDANHETCSPSTSTANYFDSAAGGRFEILWKESGTGTKQAVILLNQTLRAGEVSIVRIPDPADTDAEGLVTGVFIQDFTGLPVANADGEEVLLYLVGGA